MIAGDGDMVSWESLTIDELLAQREQLVAILKTKLIARKKLAEDRLRRLRQPSDKGVVRTDTPTMA